MRRLFLSFQLHTDRASEGVVRNTCWCLLTMLLAALNASAQVYAVSSPYNRLTMTVTVDTVIRYAVNYDDVPVIVPSKISMAFDNGVTAGKTSDVASVRDNSVEEVITRPFGKSPTLENAYNELIINFTEGYSLIVRAYDEGVAYRFTTSFEGDVIVEEEQATFDFAFDPAVIFPEADAAMQSWERSYTEYNALGDIPVNKFSVTPTMFTRPADNLRVVVAESDLLDYPGMYLIPSGGNSVKGKWAAYPASVSDPHDVYAYHRVLTREDYLARTQGTRKYPWRVVIVSSEDKDLLTNELIFKLASPQMLDDVSWIKPGKSAWEWWHDAILETPHIPSGPGNLNLALYKYYVDFAAENKLEYVTLDAGWGMDYVRELCQYAASRNVKIFLWDFINMPIANPARLAQFKNLGAAGIKVDLIERDDQVAINWFEQLARACAENELMIIFHGSAKPTGLQRKYPNIVNFEAVRGAECAKWDDTPNPDYHLQLPFIRMLAGPLDYTPGSMRNLHWENFEPIPHGVPNTIGTRVHELAMYVIFDQPLAYLCDAPTEYRKYIDIMRFLSAVPTVWDKTIPLAASVGEYAVVARQNGDGWYVGAMTNHEARRIEIDFSFLPPGIEMYAEIFRDNEQTDANAKAHTREVVTVNHETKLDFSMARGGGVVMHVTNMVTGIGHESRDGDLTIYQRGDYTVTVESTSPVSKVRVANTQGRICLEAEFAAGRAAYEFDVSNFSEGIYIVYARNSRGVHARKFLR